MIEARKKALELSDEEIIRQHKDKEEDQEEANRRTAKALSFGSSGLFVASMFAQTSPKRELSLRRRH